VWGFEWRRDLYSWEESDLTNLKNTIISSLCLQDMSDYWCWTKDRANGYNSASTYAAFVSRRREAEIRPGDDELHFL
jgi:hypothetical protein